MTTALEHVAPPAAATMEQALIGGDLSKLSSAERLSLYNHVCDSLGLNPLTRPFEYIVLNNKLTLYAKRDCTDQLRKIHQVGITIVERGKFEESVYVVRAQATLPNGRTDEALGAVNIAGLKGENLANALMKAETKSKRRVTLSICGLGLLDETEVETIPQPRESRGTTMRELREEAAATKDTKEPVAETVDTATGEVLEAPIDPVTTRPVLPEGQWWVDAVWVHKTGEKKGVLWTLYKIKIADIELSTFDGSIADDARKAIDQHLPVVIESHTRNERIGPEITKLTIMPRPDDTLPF